MGGATTMQAVCKHLFCSIFAAEMASVHSAAVARELNTLGMHACRVLWSAGQSVFECMCCLMAAMCPMAAQPGLWKSCKWS